MVCVQLFAWECIFCACGTARLDVWRVKENIQMSQLRGADWNPASFGRDEWQVVFDKLRPSDTEREAVCYWCEKKKKRKKKRKKIDKGAFIFQYRRTCKKETALWNAVSRGLRQKTLHRKPQNREPLNIQARTGDLPRHVCLKLGKADLLIQHISYTRQLSLPCS